MSDFNQLRSDLAAKRASRQSAASQLSVARAQLKDTERRIAELKRLGNGHREELDAIEQKARTLGDRITQLRRDVAGHQEAALGLLGRLAGLADPTTQIGQWRDGVPILLFPVRLETRFHRPRVDTPAAAAAPAQLWIRIYPDECQVDSFEEMLTESEVKNARAFWAGVWRAAGVEAQERGAWRSLVGGSGSGRAAYIVRQYQPVNAGARPSKIDPQDVVLVIVPQVAVTPAEQTAAFTYYTAVWKADGDATLEAAALTALRAAVGNPRADEILEKFAPDPVGQQPPKPYTRAQVRVSCAVLDLPVPPATKTNSWTQAPKAFALPDRFVALLWRNGAARAPVIGKPVRDGLAVGPDPSLSPAEQIKKDGDDLALNEDLRWMADFQLAVDVGMGLEVDLTPDEAAGGFDRLVVIGLRLSSDETEGAALLHTLIAHRYASRQGFGLVPQGSPTNNTEAEGAGYTWIDDPDASYDVLFKGTEAFAETTDLLQRRDGEWLADALGLEPALLKGIANAAGRDQGEARAMNVALWPATLGYAMEEMMAPLFSRADIAATRWFFTRFVSGRGPLPALRFGRQPYGLLPAMAFSRYRAIRERQDPDRPPPRSHYLQRLHQLLANLDADWRAMSTKVPRVAEPGPKPHQTLLDIVGLHSGSVEYHQRYAESLDQLYNKLTLQYGALFGPIIAAWLASRGQQVLADVGADPQAKLPILEKFFFGESPLLRGPVVDDVPLSETVPIRGYTPDKKNYLEWLATSPLDAIRREDFGGNPAPTALLYLFLRHAMMLGQWDAGTRFLEKHSLVDSAAARLEPAFVHVQSGPSAGQSKFHHLYSAQPLITGDNTTTVAEYLLLPSVLATALETLDLRQLVAALAFLAGAPTARLERLFAEHIDCCSYRLDAWKTGLAASRLEEMRAGSGETPGTGLYLGAFGWLEHLRPKAQTLSSVPLDAELAAIFQRPGDAPLGHDAANAGYIHAPSLNHAATAAILKNAYRVNATPANSDAMAVNLTSNRVRKAMSVLEGIRNGQTLAALLGYRFERALHDAHNLAEVDKFIYPLRGVFPLVANHLKSTKPDDPTDITLLEARNVVDGLKLVARLRNPAQRSYPFGFPIGAAPGQLPFATGPERDAIDAEANAIADLHDAVADLVMAESTHQVVLGNFDRAAANTTAFSKGTHPPEVEVVNTPRTGLSLTHRIALHLDPSVNPAASPSAVPMTPRARAEAPLNAWLASRLPAPANVVVRVTCSSPVTPATTVTLSQVDLGLQPIDLVYLISLDLDQALSELDDRILQVARYGPHAHPDLAMVIEYTQPSSGNVTLFELTALVRSLRPLILKSRPVGPSDMTLPLEATPKDVVWDAAELEGRISAAMVSLSARRNALVTLETDASDLDDYARQVSDQLLATALFGVPQTGAGQIHADVRAIYDAVAAKAQEFVTRWEGKAADYATLLAALPALTTDEERIALLQTAEGLIASTTTAVPPPNPVTYQTTIVDPLKVQFDARLAQLKGLLAFAGAKLVDYAAAATAMTPLLAQHDAVPFDVAPQNAAIVSLRATLVARVTSVAADITQRMADAQDAIAAAAALETSEAQVQQLMVAARLVLGDEIRIVPQFRLDEDRGLEFESGFAASAALLTDLESAGRRFPVDDWMYGVARVREKPAAWENIAVLTEAFGAARADLTPVQLPFRDNDRWLALEFDPSAVTPETRLLYTAHFAAGFSRTASQCGLLIDEWPEVVPATDVVSGVTFHFDRPSSQPPQALMLAVPSAITGTWQWDDLVALLTETLESAKARAVEPAQIDASRYAQFLPATLMAVTLYQITIGTNLAMNNRIYDFIVS